MTEIEFEGWLRARLATAPQPEPPVPLLAAIAADRRRAANRTRRGLGPAHLPFLPRPRGRLLYSVATLAATVVLAAGLLLTVVNRPAAGPLGPSGDGTRATDSATTDDGVTLTVSTPKTRYAAGEAVDVRTTLRYGGSAPLEVAGSGSGLVGFGVRQLDGDLAMGPGSTDDCRQQRIAPGETAVPFRKSGGYGSGATRQDLFGLQYFNAAGLVLPDGRWEVFAELSFFDPGCRGAAHEARAAIVVDVGRVGPMLRSPVPRSTAPAPTPAPSRSDVATAIANAPVTASDTAGSVRLTIESPRTRYRAGETIEIHTALTFAGPSTELGVLGSGTGIVFVRAVEPGATASPVAVTADCRAYTLVRDVPFTTFYSPDDLRLPVGRWTIAASAQYELDGCPGVDQSMSASIGVEVTAP